FSGTQPQTAIVDFPDGSFPAPTRELLKTHRVDDWVIVQKGVHRGKTGLVLSRGDTLMLVLLPEEKRVVSLHVNTAKSIAPLVEGRSELVNPQQAMVGIGAQKELVTVPWRGTNVRITSGQFRDSQGVVQSAERVEGHEGRRLLIGIWLDIQLRLVFVDYDKVVHLGAFKKLNNWQPLSPKQHTIYGLSTPMLVGRELWLGTRVIVLVFKPGLILFIFTND
ncbi:hypothetical protein V5O48_019173, partial [Marasmius crinis-equi]